MDFHQLLAKMQELDQPAVENCGMDTAMAPPAIPPKPDTPPPSMSVNINAQGMENIEDMMKLFQKVNPDMMPKVPEPMPTLSMMPPMGPPDIKPINKLLPDFDDQNDDMPGGEKDSLPSMDLDKDDHVEPDGDEGPEPKMPSDNDGDTEKEKKEKEEEFANEPDEEVSDVDSVLMKGNDLHKAKGTYPKVAGGDNPMQKKQFEGTDLRSQIRAELMRRLEEAKGAK